MTLAQAKRKLKYFQKEGSITQNAKIRELDEAFGIFWDSCPNEDEFQEHMNLIILTPRMLYKMSFLYYVRMQ